MTRRDSCYWCGTETFSVKKVGQCNPKLATIDHIRSKPECLSKKEYTAPDNTVNACFACNQRRSLEWCRRRDAGLAHPTEWSIKQAEKNRARKLRRRQRAMMREPADDFAPARINQEPSNIMMPPSWELLLHQLPP